MAKYGLLFAYEEIVKIADDVIKKRELDVVCNKVVSSVECVNEARKAVEKGADIIIARGYQAMLIKKNTNIPVVDLRLHAQEIGLLIKRAKIILQKEHPTIGIVVFSNMLSDMSCMEELFDVKLLIETIDKMEDALECVNRIVKQGAEIFIGGETVSNAANTLGYTALIYRSSMESVLEAFREAEQMAYILEMERQNEVQFETVLDTTLNGIIKLNADGNITVINKLVEGLIGKNMDLVVGLPVMEVFPDFEEKLILDILNGVSDSCTTSVTLRGNSWILLMAPIVYRESITGAVLSLQKISENTKVGNSTRKNMFLNGFTARHEFKNLQSKNEKMKAQITLAREYSLSNSPVLIYAEEGTEYFIISEAIHNNSPNRNGPFIYLNIGTLSAEKQMEEIFGRGMDGTIRDTSMVSAAVRANHGTLFLKGIEFATLQVQRRIIRLFLQDTSVARTDVLSADELDVRLIVSSRANLQFLMSEGKFSSELYYNLQGLVIEIPPLRDRTEDLSAYFNEYFRRNCKKYSKYLTLTAGAKQRILELKWAGNVIQVKTFCERLVLSANKRNVDEVFIQNLYDELYPELLNKDGRERLVVYRPSEADELEKLMERFHGNRRLIADELGISTTTLWRRLKKYGVNP